MNSSELIRLMNQSPFGPLEIHLSDGTSIRVEEPYQISTGRLSPICTIFEHDGRMRIVAIHNITEVITAIADEA